MLGTNTETEWLGVLFINNHCLPSTIKHRLMSELFKLIKKKLPPFSLLDTTNQWTKQPQIWTQRTSSAAQFPQTRIFRSVLNSAPAYLIGTIHLLWLAPIHSFLTFCHLYVIDWSATYHSSARYQNGMEYCHGYDSKGMYKCLVKVNLLTFNIFWPCRRAQRCSYMLMT